MSELFQIPFDGGTSHSTSPFARFGLEENPFPDVGLESGVLYSGHMIDELQRVNEWIRTVGHESQPSRHQPGSIPPLAVYGSLGVGKTHLLRTLERGLAGNPSTPVLRKGLTDEGMTRFVPPCSSFVTSPFGTRWTSGIPGRCWVGHSVPRGQRGYQRSA